MVGTTVKLLQERKTSNYWINEYGDCSRRLNIKIKELREEVAKYKKLKRAYNKLKRSS